MSRHANQFSVDEKMALYLQYGLSDLTINDDVLAREIQEQYQNKLLYNDAAIALEIHQEEAARVNSCLQDDEELARTLQEIETGNGQRYPSDDEKLAIYLQEQHDESNNTDEDIQETHQHTPMQVNHSYISQLDAPSTSRAISHYDDANPFSGHHDMNARTSSNISSNESTDPANMTYEELNELEESIGDVSRGLSKGKISRLPTHKYGTKTKIWWWRKKKKFVANDSQCSICLVDYAMGDKIITLPCNHIYHKDCITQWLNQNKVCCVCKAEV